jgi:hypothetical protein
MRTQRSSLTESSRSSLTESSVRTHESLYTLAAPGPVQKASVMGPRRMVTRRPQVGRLQRKLVRAGHGVALAVRVGPLARKSVRLLGRGGDRSSRLLRSRERSAKLGCSVVAESLVL